MPAKMTDDHGYPMHAASGVATTAQVMLASDE